MRGGEPQRHLDVLRREEQIHRRDDRARLDPERFLRIHRTHLVNLDHVVAFRRREGRVVAEMDDGARLPVSRERAKELRATSS